MGKKESIKWDLYNISGCKINNLMIDVGNTIKELENKNTPKDLLFIFKGIYSDIHDLRSDVGNTVSSCIDAWEKLECDEQGEKNERKN